ncbi:Hypothetical predicted protein [Olea europaea subsp. europaea]|uniref:Uncharacterized protein n=1 Tax=Olea europaea subsp. europaea TaxID=158383 RepID=A0A8S0PJW4_OLEEU|nr:Hypothetical predicted protein [Olea europaea subsp. europaea]
MPYDDPSVLVLDNIARTVVVLQFNASGDGSGGGGHAAMEDSDEEVFERGSSEEQTSRGDEEKGMSGRDRDGEDTEDTGESNSDRSSAGEDNHGGDRDASSSLRPPQDNEAQNSTARELGMYKSLRVLNYPRGLNWFDHRYNYDGRRDEDVYGGPTEPCPDEQDILIDTGNMQDATHIVPCQDDVNLPMAIASEEVQGTASFYEGFF